MKSRTRIISIVAPVLLGIVALFAVPGMASAHEGHDHGQKEGKKKTQKVNIGFTALNGSAPVSCGKPIAALGNTSRDAQLNDLRFYVSGMQLLRKGGGAVNVKLPTGSKWNYSKGKSAVTLIDLENGKGACATEGTKGMNSQVRGTVPKGKYVGARYSVSVPQALNHTDLTATPAPLNLTAMGWSWQFGRKFAKIELSADGGPAWGSKIFYLHLGSTDCKGNPAAGETAKCGFPNRNRVTLKKFNPAKQRIAIDFKPLFGGVDVTGGEGMGDIGGIGMSTAEGMDDMRPMQMDMPGCMSATSSPDCAPIFSSLGLKLGSTKKTNQTAFRVVRK